MRGAVTAVSSGRPRVTAPRITCRTPEMIVGPPDPPTTSSGRQQGVERHEREGGIAVPPSAIREALRHRAGGEMLERRAVECLEVVAAEDAEHLKQHAA